MNNIERRYDIDWLRVIAIVFLIIYHLAIGFQSWGLMIGFITNKESWAALWAPMSLLNVWRIPLLFFVSGMGVYFALQKRDWIELIKERSKRILLPFVVGIIFIVPLHLLILQSYYSWDLSYKPNPSHLWFLGNIFSYTVFLLPIFIYLKNQRCSQAVLMLKRIFSSPMGILLMIGCFMIEAVVIQPLPYELYAMTLHGYILGFLAFFFGFIFMFCGKPFWDMLLKWKWAFLLGAVALYAIRTYQGHLPLYLLSIESNFWVLTLFAFGHKKLNQPSALLSYLSQSAYPVYIVHMIFLYGSSYLIFPLNLDVSVKFILVLTLTTVGSLGFYDLIIKRTFWLRPLFGLKKMEGTSDVKTHTKQAPTSQQ